MTLPFFLQRTILSRTLWPIALVIILVLIGATTLISHSIYNETTKALSDKAQITVQTMADAAVTPVWDVSVKEAEKLLHAIAPDPDFVRGAIYLEDNSLFAQYQGQSQPAHTDLVFTAPITRQTRSGALSLGKLELTYTTREASKQARKAMIQLIIVCSLLFVFIIGTLYLILRAVTRPLVLMTQAMEQLSHGNVETEIPRSSLGGELAAMANAMSIFKNNAIELYQLMEEQKKLRIAAEKDARISLFLKQVAAAANSKAHIDTILRSFLNTSCKLFQWPIGHVLIVDFDRNALQSMGIWYLQNETKFATFKKASEHSLFTPGAGIPGVAWSKQAPVWIENSNSITNSPRLTFLQSKETYSGVAFPVLVHGKVRYVIELISDTFKPMDRDLFTALTEAGSYLTQAIERREKEKQLIQATALVDNGTKAMVPAALDNEQDIRTPMHSVLGMLSLVLETELSDTQRNRSDVTRQSAESLVSLINDIIDLSNIEESNFLIENTSFNLHETIENIARLYNSRAQQKGLAILLDLPPSVPVTVSADFLAFRQVILNVLDNAIKFTAEGHILLRTLLLTEKEKTCIQIQIKDTGCGLAPEKLSALFEDAGADTQNPDVLTTSSGLGLHVSKKLVKILGGAMGAHSEAGKGSTVWFSLPVTIDPSFESSPYRLTQLPRQLHNILVLDSYAIDRREAAWALAKWGIDSTFVEDAKSFIKYAQQNRSQLTAVLCPTNGIESGVIDFLHNWATDARKAPWIGLIQPLGQMHATPPKLHGKASFLITPPLCQPSLFKILNYLDTYYKDGRPSSPVMLQTINNRSPDLRTSTHLTAAPHQPLAQILVVDDQSFNLILMESLLTRYHYAVDTAPNALEAIEKVKKKRYDIIFMDCQMPSMDGFEAALAIRKIEDMTGTHTPIIAFTANTEFKDREKCITHGMDGYIPKPINNDKVLSALQQYLPPAPKTVL